jgi:glutamine cyclotransferase
MQSGAGILIKLLEWFGVKTAAKKLLNRIIFCNIPIVCPKLLRAIPHQLPAHTQGLYHDGSYLYESAGLYGSSSLRLIEIPTGRIIESISIEKDLFAEGIAAVQKDRLVMLTWINGRALIYRIPGFTKIGEFKYGGEGWGLTSKNGCYIMSDGSHFIHYRDTSFELVGSRKVTMNGFRLKRINDIAYAEKKIYANVLYHKYIYEICENTGKVQRIFDCSALEKIACDRPAVDVLNGIAFDPVSGSFYITGKNWRYIFQVLLEPSVD